MTKVQKTMGEFPTEVVVLDQMVTFDETGFAEVENDEVLAVLEAVPGYVVFQEPTKPASEDQEDASEEATEEPKKVAPPKKRPGASRIKKED